MHSDNQNKKTVAVFLNNDIILSAVKKTLEGRGYQVCQDIQACAEADFAFIGFYFAMLGILRQVRRINLSLPLILITSSEHEWRDSLWSMKDFYDVIKVDGHNEIEICQKIEQWFCEGSGNFLSRKSKI